MTVTINGEARSFSNASSVVDLVRELNVVPETLLIEHNGVALHRSEWTTVELREGDRLELVRIAAGG